MVNPMSSFLRAESEPATTTGYDCGILAISQTKYAWRLVKCDEPLYAVTGVCEGNFYPKSNSTCMFLSFKSFFFFLSFFLSLSLSLLKSKVKSQNLF